MSNAENLGELVLIADDPDRWSVGINRDTFDRLKAQKRGKPSDLIAIWIFFAYCARWQRSGKVRAKVSYVIERLCLSRQRVRAARNLLKKLGLLNDVRHVEKGKKPEWRVEVRHLARGRQYDADHVLLPDDPNLWSVGITKETIDRLLKEDHVTDLIAVWIFYAYTARWQQSVCVYAVVSFVSKGLAMSKDRVHRARRTLKRLGLIEDAPVHRGRGKVGWYVRVQHLARANGVKGNPYQNQDCQESDHKCTRTDSVNAQGRFDPRDRMENLSLGFKSSSCPHSTSREESPHSRKQAVVHELRSNYQARMGMRISGKNSKSMTWERIAASFESSTANDPVEFMDAQFVAVASHHDYPRRISETGLEGPWENQLKSASWCQTNWRAHSTGANEGRDSATPGEDEWRILKTMALQALKSQCGDSCQLSDPKVLACLRDSFQTLPAVVRCAFSFNDPEVLTQCGKEASEYLRLRHAVARALKRDGLPLPPGFVVPPCLIPESASGGQQEPPERNSVPVPPPALAGMSS